MSVEEAFCISYKVVPAKGGVPTSASVTALGGLQLRDADWGLALVSQIMAQSCEATAEQTEQPRSGVKRSSPSPYQEF